MTRAILTACALLLLAGATLAQTATPTPTPIVVFKLDLGGNMIARKVVGTITPGLCPKSQADGQSLALEECGGGPGGSGDVTGPVSSTDGELPRFDGVGGDTLQGSGVTVSDTNQMSFPTGGRVVATEYEAYPTDTPSTCGVGIGFIYYDDSEDKWKRCEDGVVFDLGQSGDIAMKDEQGVTCVAQATAVAWGESFSCAEGDTANDAEIAINCSERCGLTEANIISGQGLTKNTDADLKAALNVDTGNGGILTIGDRALVQAPAIQLMCKRYELDSGRRYCRPFTHEAKTTAADADQRMAFTCANLRAITATFSDPDDGSDYDWPSGNTLTIGFAILPGSIPGTTHCTYVSSGGSSETSCDDIDAANAFSTNNLLAVWINNSGSPASSDEADVFVQAYCGH